MLESICAVDRDSEREARLSDAGRPNQSNEPRVAAGKQRGDSRDVRVSAD